MCFHFQKVLSWLAICDTFQQLEADESWYLEASDQM
jgi:hypothetical protein